MSSAIAVIDFETTGMSPTQGARATEVAIVLLEQGQVVDRFQSLMQTGAWVSPFITDLTGITNAMLRTAPPRITSASCACGSTTMSRPTPRA